MPCWSGSAANARVRSLSSPPAARCRKKTTTIASSLDKELAGILRELPKRPLLAGDKGIRLSLAGAQDKVTVRIEGGEVSVPLGGAPSTHILKPPVERFEGVVFNEALCMRLAAASGLPAASVETRTVDGIDFLVLERYDRLHGKSADDKPRLRRRVPELAGTVIASLAKLEIANQTADNVAALIRERCEKARGVA